MVEHERTGIVDLITWSFSRVAMWAPAFVVGVMFYEVVVRYLFVKPTLWANELSLWVAGAIYLTAGLYAMQQRSHIRIFILYDVVPRWLQRVFDILSVACIWIFAGAVIWGGYGEAYAKLMRWERFGTAWDPPIPATMKPLILLTLVFLALQALSNLIHDWNRGPEPHGVADDIDIPVEDDLVARARTTENNKNA
ncbi:TRAP transporter small permease [Stappia sp. F7233]|uniref:TRAP transporter small permease protein n=1 Tax=Stappia albiluteola TaxID=2758565 RepID=A0A839AEM4_9HYPH|nr:TRAP transporter small permease [Stappia albiluteola]MBA5777576.1 TRAP transporter small permease [Stappia albiluteola]